MLSLAAGLLSTGAMAAPNPGNTVSPCAKEFLVKNHIHVYFHTQAKAEAFAQAHGIASNAISVFKLGTPGAGSASENAEKIWVINKVLPANK